MIWNLYENQIVRIENSKMIKKAENKLSLYKF